VGLTLTWSVERARDVSSPGDVTSAGTVAVPEYSEVPLPPLTVTATCSPGASSGVVGAEKRPPDALACVSHVVAEAERGSPL
jgi:hypothetical protein